MNNVLNEGKEDFSRPILWIVIPCYNEEDVLPITAPMFLEQIQTMISKEKISAKSRILFVNDGSKDSTWDIICKLAQDDEHYIGISQSRNRGHQNAVLAGLMEARDVCDITISIDCDGQDDITAMERMVDEYLAGAEVVYGVRSKRDTDTFFKRFTAESFYKLLDKMGVETVYNHADYRLISARVLQEFAGFQEVNIFLRGMIPLVGYKSTTVYYERHERIAGESHYPLSKMLAIAVDGITSLSVRPISIIRSRLCSESYWICGNYMGYYNSYSRECSARLGIHCLYRLFPWRHSIIFAWSYWRIYWEDISGIKTSSKIYNQ